MVDKTRVIIKYINKETQVIYTPIDIHELKRVFSDRVYNDSKWVVIDSFFIQLDKIINIEFSEY